MRAAVERGGNDCDRRAAAYRRAADLHRRAEVTERAAAEFFETLGDAEAAARHRQNAVGQHDRADEDGARADAAAAARSA